MSLQEQLAQALSDHWALLIGAGLLYREWQRDKRERREEERLARDEARVATTTVVRDLLAEHVKDEEEQLGELRAELTRGLTGITELLHNHDERLRKLERE